MQERGHNVAMSNTSTALPDRRNQEAALIFMAVPAIILGTLFLYFIGHDALLGRHPFQFFADSNTYHDLYSGVMITPDGFVDVSYNFLGPMLILTATGGNIYLVLIFNIFIFIASIISISRMLELNPVSMAAIQFLSPLTAFSLLSVNKEILIFPVFALLISSYRSKSVILLLGAIAVSLLARWQLTVFCITLAGLYIVRNLNRYLVLSILLVAVSFAYYLAKSILDPVLKSVELSTSTYTEGSGIFEYLNSMQDNGLYFLAAPAKAAHLLFSLGFRFHDIIYPIVVYNDQVIGSFCLINFIMFLGLLASKKVSPNIDLIMISFVYLIVFALTPVYAPRYFYPVTVLWALVLAGAKAQLPFRGKSLKSAAAYA